MPTHSPVIIEDLFGKLEPASGIERWTVVHTKPRSEKKLADYAQRCGISYYLPQMESKRVYQRRLVAFTKPMFPGYLFSVLDADKKQQLAASGLTAGFIRVPVQEELLAELRSIKLSMIPEVEYENTLWLSEGLKVEIIAGPLKGVCGIVASHEKMHEIRLQVDILRQAVMVRVKPSEVKVLGDYKIVDVEQ